MDDVAADEKPTAGELALQVLRRILTDPNDETSFYVGIDAGVIDGRYRFTDEEKVLLRSLRPAPPEPHFECPVCHRRSFNRNDIENRYCGDCHAFFGADHPVAAGLSRTRFALQWRHNVGTREVVFGEDLESVVRHGDLIEDEERGYILDAYTLVDGNWELVPAATLNQAQEKLRAERSRPEITTARWSVFLRGPDGTVAWHDSYSTEAEARASVETSPPGLMTKIVGPGEPAPRSPR